MSIYCSNCGMKIPYLGNVCPYCHADKTKDKEANYVIQGYVGAGGLGVLLGAFIGYQIHPGWLCLGSFIGLNSSTQ